jgi:16S rRNA (uracil1498-N3)-methyltransferase
MCSRGAWLAFPMPDQTPASVAAVQPGERRGHRPPCPPNKAANGGRCPPYLTGSGQGERARRGHSPAERESPLELTLTQGIPRGERMDYTLQKVAERGVSRIVPTATRCSVVRLSAERGERRAEHWAKVVQAACEQSRRTRVPRLLPVAAMDEWLSAVVPGLKLLLIRRDGACRLSELAITLLIGPEGGFAAEEASAAEQAGYRALRLGPRVLRTETAAVAALSALQALWDDLG